MMVAMHCAAFSTESGRHCYGATKSDTRVGAAAHCMASLVATATAACASS